MASGISLSNEELFDGVKQNDGDSKIRRDKINIPQ